MHKSFRIHIIFLIFVCVIGILIPRPDQKNQPDTEIFPMLPQGMEASIPLIQTDLPHPALRNNTALINNLLTQTKNNALTHTRFPSIMGSYYAYFTMKALDSAFLEGYIIPMENFLLSRFDPITYTFREEIDYMLLQELSPKGALLERFPCTHAISHQMALLLLADMGPLPFNAYYITMWIQQIKAMQQANGGFSTLYPNGTLLETYFALATLKALYQNAEDFLTPEEKEVIITFIRNSQRSASWVPFIYGVFNEYSLDPMVGWEYFLSSWYAVKILELIGNIPADIVSNFRTFLTTYTIYNPTTHSFYSLWNERTHPEITYYYGTALIGECVRIMGITDYNSSVLASTILGGITTPSEWNVSYFRMKSGVATMDLSANYYICSYLAKGSALTTFKNSNYSLWLQVRSTLAGYFIPIGGASYYPNIDTALPSVADFLYYHTMASVLELKEEIAESEVFTHYMSRAIGNRFVDVNLSATLLNPSLVYDLSSENYNPVVTDYYALRVLEEYDLMGNFSIEVGEDYLEYEQYPRTLWIGDGRFRNSSLSFTRGDLRSTYAALKSQEILIRYHVNQTFEPYYNASEWTLIRTYLQSLFILINESMVLSDGESWIPHLERMYYLMGFNELFALNISTDLFREYIATLPFPSLTEMDKYWVCRIIIEYTMEIPAIATQLYTHADLQTLLTQTLANAVFNRAVCTLLYLTHPCFTTFTIYTDYPQMQSYGSAYVFQFQFASHLSLEGVQNFQVSSEIATFITTFQNTIYWATVYPYFNPTHPYEYTLRLQFVWHGISMTQLYAFPIQINALISACFTPTDRILTIIVDIPMDLALHIHPQVKIRQNETIITTYSDSHLLRTLEETRTTYRLALLNYLGGNYSYEVNFQVTWLNPYTGTFEMPPPPETTTSTETTSTTTTTTETTINTTNTTTTTTTTETTTNTTNTNTTTTTTTTPPTNSSSTTTESETTSTNGSTSPNPVTKIPNVSDGRILRTSGFATGAITLFNTALVILKKKVKFSRLG